MKAVKDTLSALGVALAIGLGIGTFVAAIYLPVALVKLLFGLA
jgi:hypothetical protein